MEPSITPLKPNSIAVTAVPEASVSVQDAPE